MSEKPTDEGKLRGEVVRFKLEKFEGDYEEGKKPFEVIEGGKGRPTTIKRFDADKKDEEPEAAG